MAKRTPKKPPRKPPTKKKSAARKPSVPLCAKCDHRRHDHKPQCTVKNCRCKGYRKELSRKELLRELKNVKRREKRKEKKIRDLEALDRRRVSARKAAMTRELRRRAVQLETKEAKQNFIQSYYWKALEEVAAELGYGAKRMRDELFSPGAKGRRK